MTASATTQIPSSAVATIQAIDARDIIPATLTIRGTPFPIQTILAFAGNNFTLAEIFISDTLLWAKLCGLEIDKETDSY